MGVPTFVGAGTLVGGTAGIEIVPHASHAAGDYELLIMETMNEAISMLTLNGFSEHPGSPVACASGTATVATRLTVYERIWNGTHGSPATTDAGNHVIGTILSFRRSTGTWATLADARSATSAVGFMATPEQVEDTSIFWDLLTTDTADQLIIHLVAQAKPDVVGGTAEMSAHTNANLTNITERFDDADSSGNGGWLGAWTGEKATAGSTGTSTATGATASFHACLMIAIRDSVPGPTEPPPPHMTSDVVVPRLDVHVPTGLR